MTLKEANEKLKPLGIEIREDEGHYYWGYPNYLSVDCSSVEEAYEDACWEYLGRYKVENDSITCE